MNSSTLPFESVILLLQSNDQSRLKILELGATLSNKPPLHLKLAGTKVFMSIGGLLGEPQTFMQDLESVFWVLFWIYIHHDSLDKNGKVNRRIVPKYEEVSGGNGRQDIKLRGKL